MITPVGQVPGPGLWSSVCFWATACGTALDGLPAVRWNFTTKDPAMLSCSRRRPNRYLPQSEIMNLSHPVITQESTAAQAITRCSTTIQIACTMGIIPMVFSGISTHVEYYFDDTLYWGRDFPIMNATNFGTPSINLPENTVAFHSPFYWTINVQIGGHIRGMISITTYFQQRCSSITSGYIRRVS